MRVILLWDIDLYANSDNLPASLGEECALLPLEETTGRARSHLGEIRRGGRGEKSHKLVACRWCRVFSRCGSAILRQVDILRVSEHDGQKMVGELTT
jgi:hypothetical protein